MDLIARRQLAHSIRHYIDEKKLNQTKFNQKKFATLVSLDPASISRIINYEHIYKAADTRARQTIMTFLKKEKSNSGEPYYPPRIDQFHDQRFLPNLYKGTDTQHRELLKKLEGSWCGYRKNAGARPGTEKRYLKTKLTISPLSDWCGSPVVEDVAITVGSASYKGIALVDRQQNIILSLVHLDGRSWRTMLFEQCSEDYQLLLGNYLGTGSQTGLRKGPMAMCKQPAAAPEPEMVTWADLPPKVQNYFKDHKDIEPGP